MDAREYRDNCMRKAMEEGARYGFATDANGAPCADAYYCRSGKSENVYRLTFDRREGWKCECEASTYRGYCKHISGLVLWAARVGIALPTVAVPRYTLGGKPLA